jgi:hypothetical protein
VLTILDKGHTRDDVVRALDLLDEAKIPMRPSLLPFTPWSTLEDYRELLSLIETRELVGNVDPVQLTVRLLVPPGSLLETHEEMKPHLVALERDRFQWKWRHPDPRMDQLQADVAELVEVMTDAKAEAHEIYDELAKLAGLAASFRRDSARHARRALEVPRLTEPWFC